MIATETTSEVPDRADPPAVATVTIDSEYVRLPGLFRRWEIEQVLEDGTEFHVEDAGATADGTRLFAVYRREPSEQGEG